MDFSRNYINRYNGERQEVKGHTDLRELCHSASCFSLLLLKIEYRFPTIKDRAQKMIHIPWDHPKSLPASRTAWLDSIFGEDIL